MDPQSIVLIVGVAVLILERMFACLNRIKTSKCCGGELQLSTPTITKKGLSESGQQEIEKKLDQALEVNSVLNHALEKVKRSSQNSNA
jgi:hypothetical protein